MHGSEAAPEVLGMLHRISMAIEFRTVQRQIVQMQIVQMQPLLGPSTPLLLHGLALVDPAIIEPDNGRYRVLLVRYLIEKGDYIFAPGWPLLCSPDELAIVA